MEKLPLKEIAELPYFELNAYLGTTEHRGGIVATKKLIELTKISKNKRILDVGCGVGRTTCFIAKKYNCKVIGIDTSVALIKLAKERAKREKLEKVVEFRVADAYKIPFKKEFFDVVISENVLSFLQDKKKALKEFVRVTKNGGYAGINEAVILKTPSKEIRKKINRLSQKLYHFKIPEPLTDFKWKKILVEVGLKDINSILEREITISDRILFFKEGLSKFKLFLKIIYLSILSRELHERLFLFSNIADKELKEVIQKYYGYKIYSGKIITKKYKGILPL